MRNTKLKLMDLPNDIMVDILMRLPIKSLCCMQSASKTCLNIVDSPLFAKLHTPHLLNSVATYSVDVEVPQLMLLARSYIWSCESQFQPLKYNGKHALTRSNRTLFVSTVISWESYGVDFVFCNLVFFKEDSRCGGPCFLLNPLRGEVLKLPMSNIQLPDFTIIRYGMGFDNITSTHKIVRVYEDAKHNYLAAQVYVLGTNSSWREIRSVPPCNLSEKKVCAHGDMQWLVKEGSHIDIGGGRSHIVSFDFKKEEFYWTSHPTLRSSPGMLCLDDFHLLNLRGSMAIVDASLVEYIGIWVMKNYDKKEWVLDYKVDTRMFVHRLHHPCHPGLRECNCWEWEHGIFFVQRVLESHATVYYFLDLRCGSVKCVKKVWNLYTTFTFSFTGSLISLKNCGNFIKLGKAGVCHWH